MRITELLNKDAMDLNATPPKAKRRQSTSWWT